MDDKNTPSQSGSTWFYIIRAFKVAEDKTAAQLINKTLPSVNIDSCMGL